MRNVTSQEAAYVHVNADGTTNALATYRMRAIGDNQSARRAFAARAKAGDRLERRVTRVETIFEMVMEPAK